MKKKISIAVFIICFFVFSVCVFAQENIFVNDSSYFPIIGDVISPEVKNINYTAYINLPEVESEDISFVIYAKTDNGTFYETGIIEKGEIRASVILKDLPSTTTLKTWILFDNHKYKNAYIRDKISGWPLSDCEDEFIATLSEKVMCTVSLPEDYEAINDVEVKLTLEGVKYFGVITDLDFKDVRNIVLNNENRSMQVPMYKCSNYNDFEFSYKITNVANGLYYKGYYKEDGLATAVIENAKIFRDKQELNLILLKSDNQSTENSDCPINISLSDDETKFVLHNISDYVVTDIMAYTAYYGENYELIRLTSFYLDLPLDLDETYSYDSNYTNALKIKTFVWKWGTLKPLSNVLELDITE